MRYLFIILLLTGCSSQENNWLGDDALSTESGLTYMVLNEGHGATPVAGNEVIAHCTLKIGDSTVFWDTRETNEPFTFVYKHTSLIPGFDETIGLMQQGDRLKAVLPPELAYGPRGFGDLPANAWLSFDIEILEVNDMMLWVADTLFAEWLDNGKDAAITRYNHMKETDSYQLNERQLMILGSQLKKDGRLNDWFDVVQLRVSEYPESFSANFALGAAYEERGQKSKALQAYLDCLLVSPDNPAAVVKVRQLE
jgi:hypothetical protein